MPAASSMTSTGGTSAGCSAGPVARVGERLSFIGCPRSVDADAARLCGLAPANADVQHAVAIVRLHIVRIEVLRERDHAVEAPGEALIQVHARRLALRGHGARALARDRKHPALDL